MRRSDSVVRLNNYGSVCCVWIFPNHDGYSIGREHEWVKLSHKPDGGCRQNFDSVVMLVTRQRRGIMIRVLITAVFLTSIALSAVVGEEISIDCPDGNVAIQPPPAPIFTDSDVNPYSSTFSSPAIHSALIDDEGSSVWPDQDWNNDILIYGGRVGSGQDFDIEEGTNDIYVIFDTDHASQDSANVYRSQDGGATWTFWRASFSSTEEVNAPRIRVVNDTSGQSWVCMFFLIGNTLRMRYMTPDQSSSGWTTVTAEDVIYYDVDGEVGNNAWVYATYVVAASDNDIRATRLSLQNKTWVDDTALFDNPAMVPYPSIAVGTGGTVSVAFLDDRLTTNQQIRIKRSTNYGSSWLGSALVGDNTGAFGLAWTSIAYTHSSTENGWIFTTYEGTSSDDNLGYYYTTNAGASWTYGSTFGGTGDQNMPYIRARKTAIGSATLSFNDDPGDSTMYAWTSGSSPTNFTTPERVNDFNATGNWPAVAGWTGSFSAVLYTNWNVNYRLCFDWYGNTAVEEETSASVTGVAQITSSPNPFTDMATINFSVTGTNPVSISIYNVYGRLIKTIVDSESFTNGDHSVQWSGVDSNGTTVAPGVYFCRMNTSGSILSNRMVMIR